MAFATSSLNASLNAPNLLCYGDTGSIVLTVNGGTPNYSFLWDNGVSSQNLNGIGSGTYSVTIIDDNNCTYTQQFNITQPDMLVVSSNEIHVKCYGETNGEIDLTINGGTSPYAFDWSNNSSDEDLINVSCISCVVISL